MLQEGPIQQPKQDRYGLCRRPDFYMFLGPTGELNRLGRKTRDAVVVLRFRPTGQTKASTRVLNDRSVFGQSVRLLPLLLYGLESDSVNVRMTV